jgi:hypothetical protein
VLGHPVLPESKKSDREVAAHSSDELGRFGGISDSCGFKKLDAPLEAGVGLPIVPLLPRRDPEPAALLGVSGGRGVGLELRQVKLVKEALGGHLVDMRKSKELLR